MPNKIGSFNWKVNYIKSPLFAIHQRDVGGATLSAEESMYPQMWSILSCGFGPYLIPVEKWDADNCRELERQAAHSFGVVSLKEALAFGSHKLPMGRFMAFLSGSSGGFGRSGCHYFHQCDPAYRVHPCNLSLDSGDGHHPASIGLGWL